MSALDLYSYISISCPDNPEKIWCGREDSNFHPIAGTATSTLRVYQFRHDRTILAGTEVSLHFGMRGNTKSRYRNQAARPRFSETVSEIEILTEELSHASDGSVEWRISDELVDYEDAIHEMERRAQAIRDDGAPELVWLLEHPPLYTAGTSARDEDLLSPDRFPTFRSGRGGQYTYHGPGQRVAYAVIDLKRRSTDVRAYVDALEEWLIRTLAQFTVTGERREGRVGIWVRRSDISAREREDKIGAIGVRVRRWVAYHGISLNVDPDLEHFSGIVPCGISQHGVTSLHELGQTVSMPEVDMALRRAFGEVFGNKRIMPKNE